MKLVQQYLCVIFATAFFVSAIWQSVIIVNFYLHQDAIAAEHCVEKDIPESTCKGQCHLKKQLKSAPAATEQTKKATQSPSKTALILFVYAPTIEHDHYLNINDKIAFYPNPTLRTTKVQNAIFAPPQNT